MHVCICVYSIRDLELIFILHFKAPPNDSCLSVSCLVPYTTRMTEPRPTPVERHEGDVSSTSAFMMDMPVGEVYPSPNIPDWQQNILKTVSR